MYIEQSLSLYVEMIPDTVPALVTFVSLSLSSISEPCLNSLLAIFVISIQYSISLHTFLNSLKALLMLSMLLSKVLKSCSFFLNKIGY